MNKSRRSATTLAIQPDGYAVLLTELKARVHTAQTLAVLSVNRELIALYWKIGDLIAQQQAKRG